MASRIEGIARSVAFNEPGLIGRFFGSNAILFFVDVDKGAAGPNGPINWLPVRLEGYLKTPDFSGRKVSIEGEYDDFDRVFRANSIDIVDSRLWIGAAKRHGLIASCFWVALLLAVQWIALLIIARTAAEWFQQLVATAAGAGSATDGEAIRQLIFAFARGILGSILLYMLLATIAGVLLVYLRRTCIPTILEAIDRILRRLTEYRPSSDKK